MSSLLESILGTMSGDSTQQISRTIGADHNTTNLAIQAALPVLISALARNASNPQGAQALNQAVSRDHDGSILGNLSGYLSNVDPSQGASILGHVLGNRQSNVESGLSRATGLDSTQIATLLATLAPIVMGALGNAHRSQGLNASGLGQLLGDEHQQIQSAGSPALGMLTQLLDSNNDGSATDEITKIGGDLLGGLFKSK
jgi:hypothetical protein